MPDVLIRNIDEKTLESLKKRAAENKRSLQAELKMILEEFAGPSRKEVVQMVEEIQREFKAEGEKYPDSTDEIRNERER